MTSTELIRTPRASRPPEPWSGAHRASSADLTADDVLEETSALFGVVPVYGPPVVLLAAPWVFLSLILAGPFAVLVTLVLAVLVAAALVALVCAILATPYLLFRGVRGYRASHRPMRARVAKPVGLDSPRVAT